MLRRADKTADRRREEDVGTRFFLDGLDNVSFAGSKDRVKLVIDLADVGVQTRLFIKRKGKDQQTK